MSEKKQSLQAYLDSRPISGAQIRIVALCWLVNIMDGFDLLAISFAGPAISKEWQLDATTLGVIFSSGLFGMAAGSLILGPLADRIGRRTMILLALFVMGLSTLATAYTTAVGEILLARFVTGIAIGALLPSLNTLVAEYTPDQSRNLAVSFMHLGYPIGGITGGLLAGYLIPIYGWESIFLAGGFITLVILPLVFFGLPESLHFLLQRDHPKAKAALDKVAQRLNIELSHIAMADAESAKIRLSDLMKGKWLRPGMALWACFLLGNLSLYFLINWTPTVMESAGFSDKGAIAAGAALNLGGGIGMLALGYLSARISIHRMISLFFIVGALLIMVLGQAPHPAGLLFTLATVTGFFALGGLIGLYSVAARMYPQQARAGGVGLAIGAGRFGAILGPYLGGVLISREWEMASYFMLLALPLFVVAAIAGFAKSPED